MQGIEQQYHNYWKDKRVVITGGTKGLGKSLTTILDRMGAKICIIARTEKDLVNLSEKSDNIFMIKADISHKEAIHKISGQAIGMLEGVDVLINNASYLGPTPLQSLLDTNCEDMEQVLQTNLMGPFRLIKTIIPYLQFHGGGKIINITSDASISAYPTWGAYSVSKSALDHLTAIWMEELYDTNIDIIAVDPGDMKTEMHFAAIPDTDPDQLLDPYTVASELIRFLSTTEFTQPRYSANEWRKEL